MLCRLTKKNKYWEREWISAPNYFFNIIYVVPFKNLKEKKKETIIKVIACHIISPSLNSCMHEHIAYDININYARTVICIVSFCISSKHNFSSLILYVNKIFKFRSIQYNTISITDLIFKRTQHIQNMELKGKYIVNDII